MTTAPLPNRYAAPFYTTRWTRVCLAKADSEDGRGALADLCDAYYEPVVAYLRSVFRDADAAREMSHAFFAEMLAGGTIHTADPERGRFRFYLLGAVKHFVAHHRASSRGGVEAEAWRWCGPAFVGCGLARISRAPCGGGCAPFARSSV